MLQEPEPRTYGGWRRRRGIGLWGLGPAGTLAALAAAMFLILIAAVSVRTLAYLGPVVIIAAGLGLARISGETLGFKALRRLRWWHASVLGHTVYRASAVREQSGMVTLPGVLAPVRLLSAEDGFGERYGIVWDQRTGMLTLTLRVVPASTWLADRAEADTWVANWGGWLASLGHVPTMKWVTVTVDTAPEPGSTLADSVANTIDPSAPTAAREILGHLVAVAPTATASVDTRVSLTFDPKASPAMPKTLAEAIAEASRALFGLESALGMCGVTVLGRLGAAEIAGLVRTAFDPAVRGEIARLTTQSRNGHGPSPFGLTEPGPVQAEEFPGHYQHDRCLSVTWAWQEAPRQNVTSDVLARLMAPGPYPKRVSLQYRPFPAAAAARVLETEVNAASFRAHYRNRTGRDETARDAYDQARARQAAAEEAAGAGVCLVSLFVSVTVSGREQLPRAAAWIDAAAESSKIRLHRMTYSQAVGFAATLPCGICPADLAYRIAH